MDRESVEASIERQQRRWDKDAAEHRRVSGKRYTQGTPKRVLHALFRRAERKYREDADG